MRNGPSRRIVWRVPICCGIFVLYGILAVAQADEPRLASRQTNPVWQEACREIIAGHVDNGAKAICQLAKEGRGSRDVLLVQEWLAHYEKLQKERDEFRRADHEYEISQAKAALNEPNLLVAMRHLSLAFETAKEPNGFVADPWTQEVTSKARHEADALYRKGEWANAASLYAYLENLQKDDKELTQMRKRCVRHARLEVIYKKENRQKWENDLKGIEASMVREAFIHVGKHYVRPANFKSALAGGIDNLRVLAKTTSLAETFPRLGDRDASVRFIGEITSLGHRIEEGGELKAEDAYDQFEEIRRINARTLDLPEPLLISEFMDGALEPLDRFSSMVWPSDLQEFKKHTMGKFQGVGIQIRKEKDGKLLVVTPLPGTPAHRAGIKAGDVILRVNGEDISPLEVDDIVPKIMGPKNSTVTLTVQRGSGKPFDVALIRDVITITSIRGYRCDAQGNWDFMIDPEQKIGYMRIDPSFMDGTVREMKDAIEKLKRQGCRAMILDLRFNPGGLLRTAIEVTELFLRQGQNIVSTRGDHSESWPARSNAEPAFDKDLIVLVNENSASASEIVAGALQDNHRAMILGSRTHGKGSVQNLIPLANEAAYLKLTTALYYLPSNRCPDKQPDAEVWGVTPEIGLPLWPEEVMKVIQIRRDSDILAVEGGPATSRTASSKAAKGPDQTTSRTASTGPRPTSVPAPMPVEQRPNVDPQVEAAMLILRVKLLSGQPWVWTDRPTNAAGRQTARGNDE
jgi:carboxyl-terminal processing protease